jgi:enediyne biosynthesis protein E4
MVTKTSKGFTGILVLMLSLVSAPSHAETLVFTEIGNGIANFAATESVTESVAWGDYDGDGDDDLYVTLDGANRLYRNDFGVSFSDVTETAGVGDGQWSVGAAFGDLDNDGDLDLFVVTFGIGNDVLYRNDGPIGPGGEVVFTDVSSTAGFSDEDSSRGMTLLDYDRDGLLDIYVTALGPDILYRNLGGLTFENVAPALGVAADGQGVGIVATDLDSNGWPDLFSANRSSDPNQLSLNTQGLFEDVTASAGIDKIGQGMGVLAFDYDNDLDMDLYWTTWPGFSGENWSNALYQNQGDGRSFVDVASSTGTTDTGGWGISANTLDVNLDGFEDMLITNGFSSESTDSVLFVNQNGSSFTDMAAALGDLHYDARGVAFADIDGDGDLDICITGGVNSPNKLWRNDTDLSSRNWIALSLQGVRSNRSAIGARVEVQTESRHFVKEVSGGAGRGSQNSLPLEFGLGSDTQIQNIKIYWPSGIIDNLSGLAINQKHVIAEAIYINGFD